MTSSAVKALSKSKSKRKPTKKAQVSRAASLRKASVYTTDFAEKTLMFLDATACRNIARTYGTPVIVYNEKSLARRVKTLIKLPHAYGFTPRYAVKANITSTLISYFNQAGLHFDASSHWEVQRLLKYGVAGKRILLTAQQTAPQPLSLLQRGVQLNATSLKQLELYAKCSHQRNITNLSLRINTELTSSVAYKTNVAGVDSSFGVWGTLLPVAKNIAQRYNARIERLHIHLASNTPPDEWLTLVKKVLFRYLPQLPHVSIFNVGGGFAIARYPGETTARLGVIFQDMRKFLVEFQRKYGRKIHLEVEPGAYLVSDAGILISTIDDIALTGVDATPRQTPQALTAATAPATRQIFVKMDAGMNNLLRPALYGSQHYMTIVRATHRRTRSALAARSFTQTTLPPNLPVIVVGHCCEKGDLLTPVAHNPHAAQARSLGPLTIGDYLMIGGVGAYGSALANHYNSYPHLAECWRDSKNRVHLTKKRQTLADLTRHEINIFKNTE